VILLALLGVLSQASARSKPAPPPAADAAAVVVEGRVTEQGRGVGVAATIVLADGSIVETTPDGRFTITAVPGALVTVSAPGFSAISLPASIDGPMRVYVRRGAGQGDVVVEARRDDPVVAEVRLDRERVNETPGTYDDAMRIVQSLAGVTQTPEYSPRSGDIAVRGSFPGDNKYYLDGIELPYLFHYNNYASVLPTSTVDSLTLFPSTFTSRFGDATGAIVDAESVWAAPDRVKGTVNLSVIMAAGGVEVPVGTWTLRANARRSYVDLVSPSSLQYTSFPAFSDWFARAEHVDRRGRRWSLLGFGASDDYVRYAGEPTLLDPAEQASNPEFVYGRQFQVAGFQHAGARERDHVRGSLAFTRYQLSGALPDASSVQRDLSLTLREDGEVRVQDNVWLGVGGELTGAQNGIDVQTAAAWPEVARESELLARGVSDTEELYRLKGALYVEPRWEPGIVRVQPGVRLVGDSLSGSVLADPRLAMRLHPAADTYVRAATGVYTQFPTAAQLSPVLGDPSLAPTRSAQVAGGVDQAIAGRWEIAADGWAKWGHDVVVSAVGEAPEGGHRTQAVGGSFSTRYRLRELFFAWASVDLSQARVDEGDGWVPTDYDQPFAVNVVASWTFRPTWNIGLRYRISAGLPYTPITDGLYLAASDSYEPVYGATNSERLPAYQKVDLHFEKRFDFHSFNLTPYLEAWYVPQPGNVMYLAWSYDYDEVEQVHGPGFIPLMGIRGEL